MFHRQPSMIRPLRLFAVLVVALTAVIGPMAVNGATSQGIRMAAPFAADPSDLRPGAPVGLTATAGESRVSLSWTPNSEADLAGYNVYRADISAGPTVTTLAAGDIAGCTSNGDEATAAVLDGQAGTVLTLGDLAYDGGSAAEFATCYDPTWGRAKMRTRPAPGNHEYQTPGATGYFGYFGTAAGDPTKGYYSYDEGAWHIIVLNSGDCAVVACAAGSPQEQWLRADLAANAATCTLAVWHHPRFSSGSTHGGNVSFQPFYQALYDYDADLVLSGHDHDYERFAPQDPTGVADPLRGIREFVVGTGGRSHYTPGTTQPNSEVRNSDTFGVLQLRLRPTGYDWQFLPEAGKSFTDTGSGDCHDANGPVRDLSQPLNGTTPLTSPIFTDTTVVNGTTYRYVVAAVDAAGQRSGPSTQVAGTPVAPVAPPFASDGFSRTRASGWGTAEAGGNYVLQGTAADFATTGATGTISLAAPGANRAASLTTVSARDVDLSLRIGTDKAPTGSGQYLYGVLRRTSATSEYRAKVRLAANGNAYVQATAVVANREVGIGSEVIAPGLTPLPGSMFRVRAQVFGQNPTTIRIRAWSDGQPEPATWAYTATDPTPELQSAGGLGVRAYLSSGTTNAPILVSVDDLLASPIGSTRTAPVVDSVTLSPSAAATDGLLTASFTAHDAEGDALTASYQWQRNGVDIPAASAASLDLGVTGNGDRGDAIRVTVVARDALDPSQPMSSSAVSVIDSPPRIRTAIADRTDAVGALVSVAADMTDPDGVALAYSAVGLPSGLAIDPASGVISGTLASDAAGPHDVQVTASDGALTTTDGFSWTVTATPATTVLASDAFGRTVVSGWGTADLGGIYTRQGTTTDFGVNCSTGSIGVAPSTNRSMSLAALRRA